MNTQLFRIRLNISLWLLAAASSQPVLAQREVLYEQYVQSPMTINPGFTGVRETFNMTAMFRRKWFNIQNSPSSQTFTADGTVANGKFGIGFMALNDQTSFFTTTGFSGSFAYHLGISDNWKLGLGAQGGINVLPVVDLSSSRNNTVLGSFGIGAWLRSDRLYFGISKPELLTQNFGNQAITSVYRRPLYIMAGGSYYLNDDLMILPHVLFVQEKDHALRFDLGSRFWFNEKVGIGASYRIGGGYQSFSQKVDYLQISAEVQAGKNIRLGYFYSTRQVEQLYANYSGPKGIHELMLKFVPSPNGFQKN
ncbi:MULTISPECIES: PorP/SprF family type IX secretion system membrane protein [Dyadobacter]|uniref:PorP/SprF family type IX secretion system membrane protein n=1 Tax=Dyadobacter chenhuakuii TaxID=2909339 RepID=A0A9X1QFP8_9BACT|nr:MULTISPECIES: PorP/SprF family type IX secretion system membrane protein [Dyadobacter]MCF2500540.1 PorP/SprF family type IX secretion system membrane protein [Dyadobacter chenhuakuii]MCF2518197.1 PorP/SprF family type IX secretion system membrane protein [Dyadobacter sp. CY351]